MTEHDLIRKLDRTLEDNSRVIALNGQAFRQMVASNNRLERAVHDLAADVRAAMDDMRDQIAANTQAVLRLIDRLEPPPAAGTA